MFPLLHKVQLDLGAWCRCAVADEIPGQHAPRGEYLKIDMMWFNPKGGFWDAPLMALEHENAHSRGAARHDCWRVFQIAAPLRIFIGYTSTEKTQARRVTELRNMRDPQKGNRVHMLPGGEDIVLIGHYEMRDFNDWKGTVWTQTSMCSLEKFVDQLK
jgi:hypothetical protein